MKLKKMIKYIDNCIEIKLWIVDFKTASETCKDYCGTWDIPKKYLKYELIKPEDNEGSEAIFPIDDGVIRITVVKK